MVTTSPPTTRVISPRPKTPADVNSARSSPSPQSDESSIMDEVSLGFWFDENGNYQRLSKGSTHQSSPPTPPEQSLQPSDGPPAKPPSPVLLSSAVQRNSLSRSDGVFPVLAGVSERPAAPRSFGRTSSGPVQTPGQAMSAASVPKSRLVPRRADDGRADLPPRSKSTDLLNYDEKENESEDGYHVKRGSPPLSSRNISASSSRAPLQQRSVLTSSRSAVEGSARNLQPRQALGSSRAVRMAKPSTSASSTAPSTLASMQSKYGSSSRANSSRFSESDAHENDAADGYHERQSERGVETDYGMSPYLQFEGEVLMQEKMNRQTHHHHRPLQIPDIEAMHLFLLSALAMVLRPDPGAL